MSKMSNEEALTEINRALGRWFDGQFSEFQALNRIAYITGQNAEAA